MLRKERKRVRIPASCIGVPKPRGRAEESVGTAWNSPSKG